MSGRLIELHLRIVVDDELGLEALFDGPTGRLGEDEVEVIVDLLGVEGEGRLRPRCGAHLEYEPISDMTLGDFLAVLIHGDGRDVCEGSFERPEEGGTG